MHHPGHPEPLRASLAHLYRSELREFACRAKDPEAFVKWQQAARPALGRLLGLDAIAAFSHEHAPEVELGAAEEMEGYTRQIGSITTEPLHRHPF